MELDCYSDVMREKRNSPCLISGPKSSIPVVVPVAKGRLHCSPALTSMNSGHFGCESELISSNIANQSSRKRGACARGYSDLASCPGPIFFVSPVENWAWYTLFARALIYPWNSMDLDIAVYVTVY